MNGPLSYGDERKHERVLRDGVGFFGYSLCEGTP